MGRMALIIVLGLALTVGVIGITLNKSKTGTIENVSGFQKYTTSRNIAHTAVNMALRALDRNDTSFINSKKLSVTTMGGSATVTFQYDSAGQLPKIQRDTMVLVCNSKYLDSTKYMSLRLQRTPVPFPTIGAALAIKATPVNFNASGHPDVDGRNYDATGTTLVGSGNKPGVATMTKADSTTVQGSGATLNGSPTAVAVDGSTVDPLPFLNEYKNAADYTYNTPGTIGGNLTWGTAISPAIVYCNAGNDTNFAIKFTGTIVGYGILIVRGNIQFNGNFTFYGLVIVDGFNTSVTFNALGTPQITGGVIIAGNAGANVSIKGTGSNSKIRYSSAALQNAQFINKLQAYRVMKWYE